MKLACLTKTQTDRLDYDVVFSRWLSGDDSIASATAAITGGTAEVDVVEWDGETVKVWISGGDAGETNEVIVTATTVEERVKQIGFDLKIREI